MADRNFKPDSGNDLVLEDAGSTDRLRITDGGSTILYEDGGAAALTIDTSGNVTLGGIITNFESTGIDDTCTTTKITASDANLTTNQATVMFKSLYGNSTSYRNLKWDSSNGQVVQETSSRRYKENIRDIEIDTSKILEARPVSYQDKETEAECIGLIAEELFEVCPSLVLLADIDESGNLIPDSIAYDRISVFLVAEVKKLVSKIDSLEARILALEKA